MEQSHITAKKDALKAKQLTETTLDQMYAIQSQIDNDNLKKSEDIVKDKKEQKTLYDELARLRQENETMQASVQKHKEKRVRAEQRALAAESQMDGRCELVSGLRRENEQLRDQL